MRRLPFSPRPDWQSRLEAIGFDFHTLDGETYWDESAAFSFSLKEIENDLESPTEEIEQMCLAFVGDALKDEEILKRLAIPESFWAPLAASWNEGQRNLYGRLDLAYDGSGPAKLLEYNADTPTALLESAVAQWAWLEEQKEAGVLPEDADQFNSIHERLIEAIRHLQKGRNDPLHLACAADAPEDYGTVAYLADCARQAGRQTTILSMEEIGLSGDAFVDLGDKRIKLLFKLYPWEWLFREEFGKAIPKSSVQFVEPMWKALLSNKGLLVYLWKRAGGHPNLLPAFFAEDASASLSGDVVRKPIYSREGANVSYLSGGQEIARQDGPYGAEGYVVQQAARIPDFGHGSVVIGSWLVASRASGICLREDKTRITSNRARFLPHFIAP